jgi:RNase P subunit RPR2
MVQDVPISKVTGAIITTWRVVDHIQLLLTIRGQTEDVRLVCQCGRCHWIVREQYGTSTPRLLATCHNCGTKVEFVLEGARLPKA